jgi:hypothetical protein
MQSLNEKSKLFFLDLVKEVTLIHSTELNLRGKIALTIELWIDDNPTPWGKLKSYILANYRTGSPFVSEISFFLLDQQAPGGTDHRKIMVLPQWVYLESTTGKEVSAELTLNWDIKVDSPLNAKHCAIAEAWLARLELDGFARPEDSDY